MEATPQTNPPVIEQETPFVFSDFNKVFAFAIILYSIFIGVFDYIPSVVTFVDGLHPSIQFLIQYGFQFIIMFFPLWIFVIDKYGANLKQFGFQKVKISKLAITVALTYICYFVFSLIFAAIMNAQKVELPGYEAQDPYLPLFGGDNIGLIIAVFFIVFVAPFFEELFFRGFIYRVFRKTWSTWLASILTALLFALIHFQLNSFIPLFFLGILLNFVYQHTKSVWTAVAFHMLNNSIAFGIEIFLYYNTDYFDAVSAAASSLYVALML